jgi:hypothetical protein
MKYFIFKSKFFLLAIMLFSAAVNYAQTVTVPANCRVVVAGTGGVLGLGGKVGDGGMISMPDPSAAGIFTFNPPAGVVTANWNLKGDLSDYTAVQPHGAPLQPAAGLQAKIMTYNKILRANSSEMLNPTYGRSKGQVRVSYTSTGCGSSMTFDVFKTFTTALPAIVGPVCLKPNTQYTYSVDRIISDNTTDNIGFDSYYWSGLPANLLNSSGFYTSADNSSITFTTGATVTSFQLRCCFGRVNPDSADGGPSTVTTSGTGTHTTCVNTSTLLVAPSEPIYTTAPPACVPTGTVGSPAIFTIVYPNAPVGQTYTWTAPNTGWMLTQAVNTPPGSTTLTINTAGNNNPGELTLTVTGACDPAIFRYQINRSITAPLVIVPTGSTTTCIAGTSSGNTYTLSPTTSNSIVWSTNPASVPGVTLVNATSPVVTVATNGAAAGSFTLIARSATAACNSSFVSIQINVRPTTPTFTVGTPSCVVKSPTAQVSTIAVTPAGGAGTYAWTYPAGVTCTNCTTSNPTFTLNSAGSSVTLTATALGVAACNSTPVTKVINYIAVTTSFPGGGFPDQYLVNGACGTVTSWDIGTASGVTNYVATSGNVSITSIGGGTNNVLGISGSGGSQITSVCANLAGGIQVCSSTFGTLTERQAGSPSDVNIMDSSENVIILPNPNSGIFTIRVGDFRESASATLTDFSGNSIQAFKLIKGENRIEKTGLKQGTYFIVLKIDGKQETRQIIIN